MSYCTLEEAWGPDFKKKKKSRKENRLEKEEQQMLHESIDPQILIPPSTNLADARYKYKQSEPMKDNSVIQGYDGNFISSYKSYTKNPVEQTNETVLANNRILEQQGMMENSISNQLTGPVNNMIKISKGEYDNLKNHVVEGFKNTTDEQFNKLLLYIITGIFYLLMLDTMYQLGKKSY
tara:strand:- start:755 stop:1291 length:537 start_codon:yes stop_codon:yes gene_type:complete